MRRSGWPTLPLKTVSESIATPFNMCGIMASLVTSPAVVYVFDGSIPFAKVRIIGKHTRKRTHAHTGYGNDGLGCRFA